MFKLIKIQNAGANVPEAQILEKSAKKIQKGEVLVLSAGKLSAPTATTKPTHIAMADATADALTVAAAEIQSNMVFECPVAEGTPSSLVRGAKVCLVVSDGCAVGVNTTTTSGVATVYDTLDAQNIGEKILVTFK